MTDSFHKFIAISFTAHGSLLLVFMLKAFFAPSELIDLRQAIRVDVVGLPEKDQALPDEKPTPAPPPSVSQKEASKPEPVKQKVAEAPKVDLTKKSAKDTAKVQKSALNQIKAMAALDKIQNEVSSGKAKPVKGNILAAGNALTGLEKIDFDRYFMEIETRIRQNWSLPQWLVEAQLRAQVLVLIDENGMIKKKQIVTSSGNPEFDERMMEAIDKSAPFPPPPSRLRDVLEMKGIVFNFPQRGDS